MSADARQPSCQPEWFVAAYADGALETAQARRVETHLVHCEPCRRRVLALREEARELARALRAEAPAHTAPAERAPGHAPARAPESFAPPLALGLSLSIAGAAVIGLLASTALGARWPAFLDWLHPARILGGNNMFWNLLFWLRDESRGLLELAVGLGAVAGLAALGSFLLNAFVRRQGEFARRRAAPLAVLCLGVGLGLLSLGALPAHAVPRVIGDEDVHIAKDERVDGMLVLHAESARVEGRVLGDAVMFVESARVSGVIEGNLIFAGRALEVTGAVQGNVIVAVQSADLAGEVGGSVFAAGESVRQDAEVAASAFVAARSFHFGEAGRVGRDLTAVAQSAKFDGAVGRDLVGRAGSLVLAGRVARDATLGGDSLSLADTARVGGRAEVRAPADGLALAEGARIAGGLTHDQTEEPHVRDYGHFVKAHFYLWRVVWLAGEFCLGLLLFWLVPGLFRVRIETGGDFFFALALGVASAPAALLGCALIGVTIIGIPLALLGLLAYLVAGYLAFLVVAVLVGRLITRPEGESLREFGLALLAGLLLLTLLVNLPFLGDAAWWVVAFLGLGLMMRRAREAWELRRALGTA